MYYPVAPQAWRDSIYDHWYVDDFHWFITANMWTSLAADAGTSVAQTDARKGILALTTGATDNNEAAVRTSAEVLLGIDDKPLWAEYLIQYTEANTDDANVAVGFSDAIAANLLLDDGAGPATSFSGSLIYKVDGGTVWRCISSNGATQSSNATNITAGGTTSGRLGNGYQTLRIEWGRCDSLNLYATFFIDGVQCRDATTNALIQHKVAFSGLTEMEVGAYVKAGGANSEVLNVDLIAFGQVR